MQLRWWLYGILISLGLLAIPVGTRLFVLEAFKIPAGSMLPTLFIDDHIFVDKTAAGEAPERGSVVVFAFRAPGYPEADFVKRVVGLPGDEVRQDGRAVRINGWEIPSCEAGEVELFGKTYDVEVEFLGDHTYLVAHDPLAGQLSTGPFLVPEGEFFVLGDNRDNSHDSRFWNQGEGGTVAFSDVRGPPTSIWLPTSRMTNLEADVPFTDWAPDELRAGVERCLASRPENTRPPKR